jgi:hypothetical protein
MQSLGSAVTEVLCMERRFGQLASPEVSGGQTPLILCFAQSTTSGIDGGSTTGIANCFHSSLFLDSRHFKLLFTGTNKIHENALLSV